MSKFKVEFTLKQHTPIIHFQSEQMGATLRATELKPKFDRFLKKYAFDGQVSDKFKIDKTRDTFNYKVKILMDTPKPSKYTYKTFISKRDRDKLNIREGSYFGNSEALLGDSVSITFYILQEKHTVLIEKIREYFADFILITNFGTRQNKGFGSFSVTHIDGEEKEQNIHKVFLKYYPSYYITQHQEPLKKIMQDYQRLKSGISKPQYNKSLLFEYMCSKGIRWEKRMIKEYMKKDYANIFSQLKYEKEPIDCKIDKRLNYKYIRGLLGTTDRIEFLKRNPKNFKDKIIIKIDSQDKVARFKSPITFKVIDDNIYVLAHNNKHIQGKRFAFSIKGERGILNEIVEIPRGFDIFDFLDNAMPRLKYTVRKAIS